MKQDLSDTSPEAADHLWQLFRARSGEQRLRMACEMFDSARRLVVASLPEAVAADPVERSVALLRRFHGRDLEPPILDAIVTRLQRRAEPAGEAMDSKPLRLNEEEREQMRQWLANWRRVGPILEAERRARIAALTDDEAWNESQDLLQAWQSEMTGDGAEGLLLQQNVFTQCRRTAR